MRRRVSAVPGDNTIWNGFSLLGETSLAATLDETGTLHFNAN